MADVDVRKRQLEEENKRKRAELVRAINEKKNKTLQEAAMLNAIQARHSDDR